jgi:hypothetical protein
MFLTKPMQRLGTYLRHKHIIQLKFILMKNIALLLVLSITLFVSSCKKDEVVVATKTKTELLSANTWIVNEAEATALGGVSLYSRSKATNSYDASKVKALFKADGTVTATDPNGNSSNKGTWKFTENETKMVVANTNILGLDGTVTVLKLEAKNFDFQGTGNIPPYGLVSAKIQMIPAP